MYGETKREHDKGSKFRVFHVGKEKVGERTEYDHVGIKASIFKDDNTRTEEKISKACRTLNAASGLSTRKSGITIRTCNLIYWTVVVPILTYGSKI